MHEFDSISVSSYEAASLAGKLGERSREGWDVVAVVPAGSEIVAYLRRERRGTTVGTDTSTASAADTAGSYAASSTSSWDRGTGGSTAGQPASTATEPSGWGTAPESNTTGGWASSSSTGQPASTAATQGTPSVPAGWYADPAGRYELRYWDGSAWTEHVARAGQQYTDPPIA